jgi:pyrroline-5-carboxylate reductase
MKKNIKIGIIGCGNMGKAIASIHRSAIVFDTDEEKIKHLLKKYRVKTANDNIDLVRHSDIVIIAVKPRDIEKVLRQVSQVISRQLFISIAAGVKTGYIEKIIGKHVKVIRVMPNIAAQVKRGICAICKGKFASARDLETAEKIFRQLGKVVRIKEQYLDAFTAIVGSGPAYIFYFLEILSEAAMYLGFKEKEAVHFAVEVAHGSMKLIEKTGLSLSELREKVTSKGGTTEAAIEIMKIRKVNEVLKEAVCAAVKRAQELSNEAATFQATPPKAAGRRKVVPLP